MAHKIENPEPSVPWHGIERPEPLVVSPRSNRPDAPAYQNKTRRAKRRRVRMARRANR